MKNLSRSLLLFVALLTLNPACSRDDPPADQPDAGSPADMTCTPPGVKVTPTQPGEWQWLGVNAAEVGIVDAGPTSVRSSCEKGSLRMIPKSGTGNSGGDWPAWKGQGGKTFAGIPSVNGALLSDLTALGYDAFSFNPGSATVVMPYVNLFVGLVAGGNVDEILVFDPTYGGTPEAVAVNNTWQAWDALSGRSQSWRCLKAMAKVDSAGTLCKKDVSYSWNAFANNNPGAVVLPALCQEAPFPAGQDTCVTPDGQAPGLLFVTGQKSGAGWDHYVGYLDNVRIGVGSRVQTFVFEAQ